MQTVTISCQLAAPPNRVWKALQRSQSLRYVTRGLLRFVPFRETPFPTIWRPGEYRAWLFLFGFVPIGWQAICIEPIPERDGVRSLRDNGFSPLVRKWDHTIEVSSEGDGTRYTDRVIVDAGWLTFAVARFARGFYTYRQRRWRKLIERNIDMQWYSDGKSVNH